MGDQLRCCPDPWYTQCQNALLRCQSCAAGFGAANGKVLYKSTVGSAAEHPYSIEQAQAKQQQQRAARQERQQKRSTKQSKQVREALKDERRFAQRLVRQTVRSGAAFGDGDLKSLGFIQVDHKRRFNTSNFTVTWEEYKKGTRQGTNQWVITIERESKPISLVCMTLEAYSQLLAMAAKVVDGNEPTTDS